MAANWELDFSESGRFPAIASGFYVTITPKKKAQRNSLRHKLTDISPHLKKPKHYLIDTRRSILNQGIVSFADKSTCPVKYNICAEILHTNHQWFESPVSKHSRRINLIKKKLMHERNNTLENSSFLKTQRIDIPRYAFTNVLIRKCFRESQSLDKKLKELKSKKEQHKAGRLITVRHESISSGTASFFSGSSAIRNARKSKLFEENFQIAKSNKTFS
eukprot:TRINITY_DN4336_c0_g2_i1.p1 TRINITY_DN4336_c0_g2~~TRINITY_DN4336_c0_g2_i1.p1  ORF type:complete len:218 (-),score=24.34 TRINITY_DN4336_c0_g2_i1:82-735(-)